jgi:hypothetical protein
LPFEKPWATQSSVSEVTSAALATKSCGVPPPFGVIPRKFPAVTASQKPTQRTVVEGGTSKTIDAEVALAPEAAAAQVAALRA